MNEEILNEQERFKEFLAGVKENRKTLSKNKQYQMFLIWDNPFENSNYFHKKGKYEGKPNIRKISRKIGCSITTIRDYFGKRETSRESKNCYSRKKEVKARLKEYQSRPEVKERRKEYFSRPEVKARLKEYYSLPEVKERIKEYNAKRYLKKKRSGKPLPIQ